MQKPQDTGSISSTSTEKDCVETDSEEDEKALSSRFPVTVDSDTGDDSDDKVKMRLKQPTMRV